MIWAIYGFVFVVGACFGSFANVVIYRWPRELSFVHPRSSCPYCHKRIFWYENIPLLSWLALHGRCSGCQKPISWQYPAIELITGFLFIAIWWRSGATLTSLELMLFTAAAVPCFFIDVKHMLLPDIFTLSGIVIGLLGSLVNPELRTPLDALVGVIFGGGFFYIMAWLYKRARGIDGMGGGDIKLMAWIGALLGIQSLPLVLFVSSFSGTLIGFVLLKIQKQDSKTFAIPFGPFLILAAYLYYFLYA